MSSCFRHAKLLVSRSFDGFISGALRTVSFRAPWVSGFRDDAQFSDRKMRSKRSDHQNGVQKIRSHSCTHIRLASTVENIPSGSVFRSFLESVLDISIQNKCPQHHDSQKMFNLQEGIPHMSLDFKRSKNVFR